MKDHRTSPMSCPACMALLTGALNTTGDEPPDAGDTTVCAYCATLLLYTDDVRALRLPTYLEATALLADPDVQRAIAAARAWPR